MKSKHENIAEYILYLWQIEDYLRAFPYRAVILHIEPSLNILKARTDRPLMSDVEACLTLLYQVMLLRLQKVEISDDTMVVVNDATQLMRFLSKTYYDDATPLDDNTIPADDN